MPSTSKPTLSGFDKELVTPPQNMMQIVPLANPPLSICSDSCCVGASSMPLPGVREFDQVSSQPADNDAENPNGASGPNARPKPKYKLPYWSRVRTPCPETIVPK